MSLEELFRSDPTRRLEEVQKVNAKEQAETDVAEFHETESAHRVLSELGDTIQTHAGEAPRFLYLHATFGSGKTHLLKLIGLLVDTESEHAHLGTQLRDQWPGFDNLARSIEDSQADRLKPVFLNLLDRDAAKEPPLPYMIFEAIGRELGYPTDPNWLLEWAWTVDLRYEEGIWDALTSGARGQEFESALKGRAGLRKWLYDELPEMKETSGTDLDSRDGVQASIGEAEQRVDPESFDSDELVGRIEDVTAALNDGKSQTELLLGLDEAALFIGDSRHRYREFEETMEALQNQINPVVVTTGQYSLPGTRESLIGAPPDDHWTHQQVPLQGADTEIIVRKRWLQKGNAGEDTVSALLEEMPDLSLEAYDSIGSSDPDPVESYPFREYDLTLLRTVMQELITEGRATDRDFIQGRALLVLVRSLFTKFDWASVEEGAIVPWNQFFDLLIEETTYVPLWVQEMLDNVLIPTFDADEGAWEVRVSKALYLLNQTSKVPSTAENVGRLMISHVDESIAEMTEATESALNTLVDKRKVLTETNEQGTDVYTLVSEDQESIMSRAQTKAERVSPHQLSAWLETRFRENDSFFRSDSTLHEVDIGDERRVPLRYEYSILDPVDRAPTTAFDAIQIRVLADDPDSIGQQLDTWQTVNEDVGGGEHVLIRMEVPDSTLDRIRNVIGMSRVLESETESHPDLEREHRTNKRRLESAVSDLLDAATVHTVDADEGARSDVLGAVIEEQVRAVFGPTRRVLSRPLVAVDDAKAMAAFFRGSGEWPLGEQDAQILGVRVDDASIRADGWCREFIETYEPLGAVDAEELVQQTQTANGNYRGTPTESIGALLMTLALSDETVALKLDADLLNDPTAIGRQVRNKTSLTSLRARLDINAGSTKQVRGVVSAILSTDPRGSDIDAWLSELSAWISENSLQVKRTFRSLPREFGVELEHLEAALSTAYDGQEIVASDLSDESVEPEAEVFSQGMELFGATEDGISLWDQFTEALKLLEDIYPGATVTEELRTTAASSTVPTKPTVVSRLSDATNHRVTVLSEQYRRVSGAEPESTEPAGICKALTHYVQENQAEITGHFDAAEQNFEAVSFAELRPVLDQVFEQDSITESEIGRRPVRRQLEEFAIVRELFDGKRTLWAELQEARRSLVKEHPDSPTTQRVSAVIDSPRLPSVERMRDLISEAEDPKPPVGGEELVAELQDLVNRVRRMVPNAAVVDEAETLMDQDEPPSSELEALKDSCKILAERKLQVAESVDLMNESHILLIE